MRSKIRAVRWGWREHRSKNRARSRASTDSRCCTGDGHEIIHSWLLSCPVSVSVSMSFLLAGGFGRLLILQPNHGGGGYYTVFPDLPIFLLCSGNKNHPEVPTMNCWIGADE